MRRTQISALILFFFIAASAAGHITVFDTTNHVQQALSEIRICAEKGDYPLAHKKVQSLISDYEQRQTPLKIFLRRDTAASVLISLRGLAAYTNAESCPDLIAEIDQLNEQLKSTEQLFFSIL